MTDDAIHGNFCNSLKGVSELTYAPAVQSFIVNQKGKLHTRVHKLPPLVRSLTTDPRQVMFKELAPC